MGYGAFPTDMFKNGRGCHFRLVCSPVVLGQVRFHLFGETVQTNPLNLMTLFDDERMCYIIIVVLDVSDQEGKPSHYVCCH
jgi:hypothetical protein